MKKFLEQLRTTLESDPKLRAAWDKVSFMENDPSVVSELIFDTFMQTYEQE